MDTVLSSATTICKVIWNLKDISSNTFNILKAWNKFKDKSYVHVLECLIYILTSPIFDKSSLKINIAGC